MNFSHKQIRVSREMVVRAALCLVIGLVTATSALAQGKVPGEYPTRPIKLVVPYPPGGGADTLARLVSKGMADKLGTPVVIENKPGGNTAIATRCFTSQPRS